jgi:ubiquitin-protein ligase
MTWDAILRPDEHTPYAGTNLLMRISIPSEFACFHHLLASCHSRYSYPIKPPKVM